MKRTTAERVMAAGLALSWGASLPARAQPFGEGAAPVRTCHVAATGSDRTGDGSAARPYATLSRAARMATPGTAIVLAPGEYPGGTLLADLAGTPHAPIWIRGAGACERPVIRGGNVGLHLVRARCVIIEHLAITGSRQNGLNCDDGGDYANPDASRFVVFRDLVIHDIGSDGNQDGLKLSGLADYWVLDSEFARCGGGLSGSGIDQVGCHRGVISRCRFRDLSGNAIQCKGGSADIDITRCRIVDAGQRGINIGGSTGFEYFRPPLSAEGVNHEARAIRVVGNLFCGSASPIAFVGCIDCLAANNTLIDPGAWPVRILQETVSAPPYAFAPCARGRFINNLVYFSRGCLRDPDINVGPNTDAASFTFAHNLWYAHDDPERSAPRLPVVELNAVIGRDPLMVDPVQGDVLIPLASPAAGAGLPTPHAVTDLDGRPYRNPPSIGARETQTHAPAPDHTGEIKEAHG